MRLLLEYRHPTPSHCTVAIFVNGALAGELVLRQDEIVTFQQIIFNGYSKDLDQVNARGNVTAESQLHEANA